VIIAADVIHSLVAHPGEVQKIGGLAGMETDPKQ
jgi:hypothetical protein